MDNKKPKEQPKSINELEFDILKRDFVAAEKSITDLIKYISKDKINFELSPYGRNLTKEEQDIESFQVIEKLAVQFTNLLAARDYEPSVEFFRYVAVNKNFINLIFAASSYHSTDHILHSLGLMGRSNYSPEELKRVLMLYTTESSIELPWEALLQHMPDETAQTFAGIISSLNVQFSDRAHKAVEAVLRAVPVFPSALTKDIGNFYPLISAFFNCSNLEHEDKYEIKKWVIKSLKRHIDDNLTPGIKKRIANEVSNVVSEDKRKVLIIHERYTARHAMYRCWHSMFASLKEDFEVTLMAPEDVVDETTKKDGHHFIEIEDVKDFQKSIKAILKLKPDYIIYPSLGMSMHGPLLATLRLAPVQIVCGGHPSSSYMETIDYFFLQNEDYLKEEEIQGMMTENWLPCEKGPSRMTLLSTLPMVIKEPPEDEIHIIVNGVIQKVTNSMLRVCQQIAIMAKKKVVFHFFMTHAKQNLEYFAAKSLFRRFLPNSQVHPFTNYSNYLTTLSRAHFAIPTFPFGGTNSNVDLIRMGIPKLFVLDTNDVSGMTDLQIWESLGETSGLCDSISDLKNRAIELCNSPEKLAELKQKIKAIDLKNNEVFQTSEDTDFRLANALKTITATPAPKVSQ